MPSDVCWNINKYIVLAQLFVSREDLIYKNMFASKWDAKWDNFDTQLSVMGADTAVKLRDMIRHLGNNIAHFCLFFILIFYEYFQSCVTQFEESRFWIRANVLMWTLLCTLLYALWKSKSTQSGETCGRHVHCPPSQSTPQTLFIYLLSFATTFNFIHVNKFLLSQNLTFIIFSTNYSINISQFQSETSKCPCINRLMDN